MHEGNAYPCSALIGRVFWKESCKGNLLILYSISEKFDEGNNEKDRAKYVS